MNTRAVTNILNLNHWVFLDSLGAEGVTFGLLSSRTDVIIYATRTMLAPTTAVRAAYVALPREIEVEIRGGRA